MFERYTEKARRVIFFARYEASQFGTPLIEVEHLLFALIREDRPLFTRAVPDVNALDAEIRASLPQNLKISTAVDLPMSHQAKRVLAYGAEEAERLNSRLIAPNHLLLALLREESAVSEICRKHGLTLDSLRHMLAEQTAGRHPQNIASTLGKEFSLLVNRLTPEIEPATVYLFRSKKD